MNQSDDNPVADVQKKLLFVVGLTRSGTSLLYALLNQHSRIALMYEANALYPGLRSFTMHNLERLEIWNQAISRHGLKSIDLEGVKDPRSLYLTYAREKENCLVYGEKSPIYSAYLLEAHRRAPDASFLILTRDFGEIYHSVVAAGRNNDWFNKRGSFYRLIREQEKLIHDLHALEKKGARVHRMDYRALVTDTKAMLQAACDFLGLDFEARMATLHGSDLSAIESNPEHDHLRNREIEVREKSPVEIPAARQECIARFQRRWNRLSIPGNIGPSKPQEVSPLELFFHQSVGAAFIFYYLLVRWLYEFLPLKWIRTYRAVKQFLISPTKSESLSGSRKIAIVARALTVMAVICFIDWKTGPQLTFAPFYLLPVAITTWRLGLRAGCFIGLVAAAMWSALQVLNLETAHSGLVFSWNCTMRSLQLFIFAALVSVCSRLLARVVEKDESLTF